MPIVYAFFILCLVAFCILAFTVYASVGNTFVDQINKLIYDNERVRRYARGVRIHQAVGPFGHRTPVPLLLACVLEAMEVATGAVVIEKTKHLKFAWPGALLRRAASLPRPVREAINLKCRGVQTLILLELGLWVVYITSILVVILVLHSAS